MKTISEKQALTKLRAMRDEYRETMRSTYEHRAKSCLTCETQGACCLDAHFVNVHITRLEAAAIKSVLSRLPVIQREAVYARIEDAVERYDLSAEEDTFAKTFACPLFEKGTGCLVHTEGKPLACIQHACYENSEDLPPDELLTTAETTVARLNEQIYHKPSRWLPLPVWLSNKL